MPFAALIISILAILASIFSLFNTWLKPFDLVITPGNPIFSKSPVAGEEKTYATTPIIPIEFKNNGARDGSVKALLILVKTGNKSWILRPQCFCEEFSVSALHEKEREIFHPFSLSGNEKVYRIVLFNPWGGHRFPRFRSKEDIPAEEIWVLEYYVLDSSGPNLRLACQQSFRIERSVIFKGNLIPEEESTILAIDKFVGSLKGAK